MHDCSVEGVEISANYATIDAVIIDTCGIGLLLTAGIGWKLTNSVIYNCTTGISDAVSSTDFTAFNNSITSCTTGASWTAEILNNEWDYNNWHGNTGDVTNITKGLNATAVAPEFTNAAGGDFSIAGSGNLHGTGFGMRLGVGATASLISQGVYEPTVSGGAGGLLMANKRGNKQ